MSALLPSKSSSTNTNDDDDDDEPDISESGIGALLTEIENDINTDIDYASVEDLKQLKLLLMKA